MHTIILQKTQNWPLIITGSLFLGILYFYWRIIFSCNCQSENCAKYILKRPIAVDEGKILNKIDNYIVANKYYGHDPRPKLVPLIALN